MDTLVDRCKRALRPTDADIVDLARREVDPVAYRDFDPITAGPILTVAGLLAIGILAVVSAPYRLVAGLRRARS